jgi:sugar O-acyltransferase (sialic acid O-acetyltransferase NeuD family)
MQFIYCAGEQARVALDSLRRGSGIDDLVLLDDDESLHGQTVGGAEVVGGTEYLADLDPLTDTGLVAYGKSSGGRVRLGEQLGDRGFDLFSVVDPDATVSDAATLGDGVTVNATAYVGPDVVVEDLVLIDSAANVSHDTVLRRGTTVTPGAILAGGVTVGEEAYLGAGATVRDHVTVGAGAVVGMGATVVEDVPPGETVIGTPAEPVDTGPSHAGQG